MKHHSSFAPSTSTPLPAAYPLATTRGPAATFIAAVALATLLAVAVGWPVLAAGPNTFQGVNSLGWEQLTTAIVQLQP